MHEQNGLTPMFNVGDHATLKQIEHAHIRSWMEKTGEQKKAASILGIHHGSLSRKISSQKITYIKNAKHEPETDPSSEPPKREDSQSGDDHAEGGTDD